MASQKEPMKRTSFKKLSFKTTKTPGMNRGGLDRYLNTRVTVKWAEHHKSGLNVLIILKSTPRSRSCQELKHVYSRSWSC